VCLIVLLCSAAFCIYTVAGYPLLLALLARSRPRPVRKAPWQAPVSVILPVRNGERWIGAKLESILGLNYPPELMEILVVSDGSTDRPDSIIQEFAERSGGPTRCDLRLLRVPR